MSQMNLGGDGGGFGMTPAGMMMGMGGCHGRTNEQYDE